MSETIISVRNISVAYRQRQFLFKHKYFEALKNISFEVRKGETLGIIGRNGAGKSTLLKILSGIYMPDSGVIENYATKTSLLTLQAGFDAELCGRDNARLSGMLMGYSKAKVEAEMSNIEAYSELGDFFYSPIKTYSTGMRARLGFAVATYLTPEVLLVDEVLGVGDAKFKEKANKTIEDMICSDQTVILVSHSAGSMSKLCDRIIWIEKGVIKDEGKPDEILEKYHRN